MVSAILVRLFNKFGKSLTFMLRSFHPDYLAKWWALYSLLRHFAIFIQHPESWKMHLRNITRYGLVQLVMRKTLLLSPISTCTCIVDSIVASRVNLPILNVKLENMHSTSTKHDRSAPKTLSISWPESANVSLVKRYRYETKPLTFKK